MKVQEDPPSSEQVEAVWRDLIRGTVSREAVHLWAAPWVEDRWAELDPLVEGGLQNLHGYGMTYDRERPRVVRHGPGDCYVHSEADIAQALERWLAKLALRRSSDRP